MAPGKAVTLVGIGESSDPRKKLMARFLVDGKPKTVHFGAAGYKDYTVYCRDLGTRAANEHRRRYLQRHGRSNEDWTDPVAAGTLARYILWSRPTLEAAAALYRRTFRL